MLSTILNMMNALGLIVLCVCFYLHWLSSK
ncbi:hypothetical protein PSFL_25770 [Pseudomonas sp. DD1]